MNAYTLLAIFATIGVLIAAYQYVIMRKKWDPTDLIFLVAAIAFWFMHCCAITNL